MSQGHLAFCCSPQGLEQCWPVKELNQHLLREAAGHDGGGGDTSGSMGGAWETSIPPRGGPTSAAHSVPHHAASQIWDKISHWPPSSDTQPAPWAFWLCPSTFFTRWAVITWLSSYSRLERTSRKEKYLRAVFAKQRMTKLLGLLAPSPTDICLEVRGQ